MSQGAPVVGEAAQAAAPAASAAEAAIAALRDGRKLEPGSTALHGARLVESDLSGLDLAGADLGGADLSGSDLRRSNLSGACLEGAVLFRSRLDGAEFLGSDLRGANLEGCAAEGAGFGGADLGQARLSRARLANATFTKARLAGAKLDCSELRGARLLEADLSGADLTSADLRDADLIETRVAGAVFDRSDLRNATFSRVTGFEQASWIHADVRDVDFRGAFRLRRFILDENYLHELRNRSRGGAIAYWVWWVSSDCGRSFARLGLWVAFLLVAFAALYQQVNVDWGRHATELSPLYYSVVTLTTLGYGDVVPASTAAQVVAMVEVVVGYLALGALISIFANKVARRAD
ncbi:MAG: pentapeptide repeat-containing protein [Myxococcota bacterium]|nr:pentapeptide repeat-containing protein [Myxococcota bacterium]